MRNERQDAISLANGILDCPSGDPDDDLAVLSRQFLRAVELNYRVVCSYCGHIDIGDGTVETAKSKIVEHVINCPEHPLMKVALILSSLKGQIEQAGITLAEEEIDCGRKHQGTFAILSAMRDATMLHPKASQAVTEPSPASMAADGNKATSESRPSVAIKNEESK